MAEIRIVYDGDCPFCSAYARLARLRQRHDVELVNAREARGLVRRLRRRGMDVDDGMIVLVDGEAHHGDDAAAFLESAARGGDGGDGGNGGSARGGDGGGWIRRVYPWLYRLRSLALRLLGRDPHVGE